MPSEYEILYLQLRLRENSIMIVKKKPADYAPQTHNYATCNDYGHQGGLFNEVRIYYYNVEYDSFTDKMAWLDQNVRVDMVIVDASATAQDIDGIFMKIYGKLCVATGGQGEKNDYKSAE